MENITYRFSEFIHQLKIEDIPQKTIERTRLFILDYYAACCAGYRMNTEFNVACEKLFFEMGGLEESTVLFANIKLPAGNAAFMNSCYAHGADIDDGNKKAMGHVGVHVISAVFALAEKICSSEKKVLLAIIVGYEVFCRIAGAVQPGLVQRGFHSTGTAGTIACAAACAKLLDMEEEQIYSTIFVATTQASGLLVVGESGQEVKPINPARAAQNGLQSALMVKYGVVGGENPLESNNGWFHAMSDDFKIHILFEGLGKRFAIDECYMKRFPSCRHTHGAIDVALELKKKIDIDEIEEIRVYIYDNAIRLAGSIREPINGAEAKFSIYYTVACAFEKGAFGLGDIMNVRLNKKRKELLYKIHLISDSNMENVDKGLRGTRMEVRTKDGRSYDKTIWIPKGDPENPLSKEEVKEKFMYCSRELISGDATQKIIDFSLNFGKERRFTYQNIFKI